VLFTPSQAYHLRLVPRLAPEQPRHIFCGPNEFPGGGCPNCGVPLQVFVTLDSSDQRLGIPPSTGTSLPLLWCWCCPVLEGPLVYRVSSRGIELVSLKRGRPTPGFPYADYPRPFPSTPVRLVPISSRAQRLISELNAGHPSFHPRYRLASVPTHQVGGVPFLLQGPNYQGDYADDLSCPTCNEPMPFFAAVGNRCLDPRGLCGNDFVQVLFHFCVRDSVISAIQQCD
jgi:hypothetical protein